jgi:hypothetical protein
LGKALMQLGDAQAAQAAYASGVRAARRHGHPSMAAEFEALIEELTAE